MALKGVTGRWSSIRRYSSLPEIPGCNFTVSNYKGSHYDSVKSGRMNSVTPTTPPFYKKPLLIHEGHKQWLWDHTGRRYLDMFGGVVTVSVGHSHPKVTEAATSQLSKLNHTTSIYMHPKYQEYADKLIGKLPGNLKVLYMTNSGSESNELAFLMAKVYTGAQDIISLNNSYHGSTYMTNAATGMSTWRYPIASAPGHPQVTVPDVYRGSWGGSQCRDCPVSQRGQTCECIGDKCIAAEKYLKDLKDTIQFSLPNNGKFAAFIAESIQGIGGVVQFPRTYLRGAYDIIKSKNALYIADEVQVGFGRTGDHFWGFECDDIIPDIVTMAKGIGNGFPMGAVVTTPEIAASLSQALHFNTFGGNPLACAIGSAVLDVIEEEKLQENSKVVGTYLLHRLSTLLLEYPTMVGDVRGKGLMIGVELVSNPDKKTPLEDEYMASLFEDTKDMGLLIGRGGIHKNVLRIKPPMCVTKEDADFTVEVIKKALDNCRDRNLISRDNVYIGAL
ncbi:alanine--glyoxylate aminotransferase 2, mitochondrial [Fopius arisanus]|uniref:Alanine--glyoxylate aminotransferase 2, mitochondrial n=2 Tax=Fopius arisanus TaxID=64838 RepID=A0A0C9QIF1_9HYME|nr:PREDICTED: alanine--glyoxylate aminotransferase 2, mitochondrial [Fopius arisanus]